MEAFQLRRLKDGERYNHLFPKANENVHTVKRSASLHDTMEYIPQVVGKTLHQTKRFARFIKSDSVYGTCKKIWEFVYGHIQYKKDEQGYEQIRSPARAWHDRKKGVDCDCYSVFISSVLTNLRIPHTLRITKYKQDYYQHIYPIVPTANGYITMDCVTDQFDYEVPYSAKKDYPMELQFLDGIPRLYGDANEMYLLGVDDEMGDLGKLLKKSMAIKKKPVTLSSSGQKKNLFQKVKAKVQAKPPTLPAASTPKPKKKGFLKKVLNVVNKVNPATVLLRNGVLAAMKLNIKNVAKRLRWSYLTPEKAAASGIDPQKFQRLVATRQKLENIFYGAGGKPENLKKAILGGKGNKDKAVNGFGMLPFHSTDYVSIHTPLEQLLGPDVYYSENVEGFTGANALAGLGELGEPVTLATVGAAMGVISGIVASLKQIGNIFKGKEQGSEDFDEKLNEEAENNAPVKDTTPVPSIPLPAELPSTATPPLVQQDTAPYNPSLTLPTDRLPAIPVEIPKETIVDPTQAQDVDLPEEPENLPLPATTAQKTLTAENTPLPATTQTTKPTFWDANKQWLKPTLIVGGGIAVIAIGLQLQKSNKKHPASGAGLSGLPHRKRKKQHHRHKQKRKTKTAVVLL